MNCRNCMLWIGLFILTGCTITRPVEEKTVSPSLDVTIEKREKATISLRCTLIHPPRKTGKEVWQMDALEIKNGAVLLSYSFEFKIQDMPSFDHEVSVSRFVLSPVSIRRESRQVSWRSQTVVLVSLTNVEKEITIVYHGDNTLGIATSLVNTVQIE
ncbi:MAG: hypothetical protein HYV35_02950 [Lentisphaerae bacterium]|nr:hypothetical protein [Lentisphaerota bacterium]